MAWCARTPGMGPERVGRGSSVVPATQPAGSFLVKDEITTVDKVLAKLCRGVIEKRRSGGTYIRLSIDRHCGPDSRVSAGMTDVLGDHRTFGANNIAEVGWCTEWGQ